MTHSANPAEGNFHRSKNRSLPKSVKFLWKELEHLPPGFTRDAQVLNHNVQFFCPKWGIVVEVDGYPRVTIERTVQNLKKDDQLTSWGYAILRFHIRDVRERHELVLSCIKRLIEERIDHRHTW
jgi:very-short-patch-repair endonuclease